MEDGWPDDMVGQESAKLKDVVQSGIPAESDDEVTVVEVRTEKRAKYGGSIVTLYGGGAPQVEEEMDDFVGVGKVYGDHVYAESAKCDERIEHGRINKRALRMMHSVEAAVTRYKGVRVTAQRKMDVIQEKLREVRMKEGHVQTTMGEENVVDERREISRAHESEGRRDENNIRGCGVEPNCAEYVDR